MNRDEDIKSLFEFLKEFGAMKSSVVYNIEKQPWKKYFNNLPIDNEFVYVNFRDTVDVDSVNTDFDVEEDLILSVKKPNLSPCPKPSDDMKVWLYPGWDRYENNFQIKKSIVSGIEKDNDGNEVEIIETFDEDDERVEKFDKWVQSRIFWQERQKHLSIIRDLFSELYELKMDLDLNSETSELMVGTGFLFDSINHQIDHPIFLKKVRLTFDSDINTISIYDTSLPSEIYTIALADLPNINHAVIPEFQKQLEEFNYHPLDRNDTPAFLKRMVQSFGASGRWLDLEEEVPNNSGDKIFLQMKYVFFKRKKIDGLSKFVDGILDAIDNGTRIPAAINAIAGSHDNSMHQDITTLTIEEELAEVGGESPDIYLAKAANKEQLSIAKQIENNNAILVQGPPGTGKTHTISNLMGHFLAQGKSVLVTSYTKKALSVLKNKLPENIQNLCVSMTEDTNVDMERSINGITDFMSSHNSFDLKRELEKAIEERNNIISKMTATRKQIYQIQFSEYETLTYCGESISPIDAAKFVGENTEKYSELIPGKIILDEPFPLTYPELVDLYSSNNKISQEDERDIELNLPDLNFVAKPEYINTIEVHLKTSRDSIIKLLQSIGFGGEIKNNELIIYDNFNHSFLINKERNTNLTELQKITLAMHRIEPWEYSIIADGSEDALAYKWKTLLDSAKRTKDFSDNFIVKSFGNNITISDSFDLQTYLPTIEKMREILSKQEKISKITRFFHKEYDKVDNNVKINGKCINSEQDCILILDFLKLQDLRLNCSNFWNSLMLEKGFPNFRDLDKNNPENTVLKYLMRVPELLLWKSTNLLPIKNYFISLGIDLDIILNNNSLSEVEYISDVFEFSKNKLPILLKVIEEYYLYNTYLEYMNVISDNFISIQNNQSVLGGEIIDAWNQHDMERYADLYQDLISLVEKNDIADKRKKYRDLIKRVAPEWENMIKNRTGIHGYDTPPEDIEGAWRWKQLLMKLSALTNTSFTELQRDNEYLTEKYRESTALVAELSAWYHLVKRTDGDKTIQQNLIGWQQTVKKIGAGKGKRAPIFRAEAQKLMVKCQSAVPAWIMPINTVLTTMVPGKNEFDVLIVDEASQADITALAVLFLGKKIIVVGDDKQVSPLGVGQDSAKNDNLIEMHLKGKIPNPQLYIGTTSLYDICQQICQPLMLKEHFRCAPDIIEFSNVYFYDNKIRPLRDKSLCSLAPNVVDYYVDGHRSDKNKTNALEADTTVALITAMLKKPEYKHKTIGVISLLGNEQASLITKKLLNTEINIENNSILCGDAAQFQGDERDVIILNMVDSNESDKTLRLTKDSKILQRYNVAITRAKDQLWVIHSILPGKDLKQDDIRSHLLKYVKNPYSLISQMEKIEKKSDSPFEKSVAEKLVLNGYHVTQQWEVGNYRIDMVVSYNGKKIALECDGDRYHSGSQKIKEDMERQMILERQGWRFIRIRGSEYYRNPEKAIANIIDELKINDIYPYDIEEEVEDNRYHIIEELKQEVEWQLLNSDDNQQSVILDDPEVSSNAIDNNISRIKNILEEHTIYFDEINEPKKHPDVEKKLNKGLEKIRKNKNEKLLKLLEEKDLVLLDSEVDWIKEKVEKGHTFKGYKF